METGDYIDRNIQSGKINEIEGINFIHELILYKMEMFSSYSLKNNKNILIEMIPQIVFKSKYGAQFLYSL